MADPLWGLLAPFALGLLVVLAAGVEGVVEARRGGRTVGSGLLAPVGDVARLLRQQPRRTVQADLLLTRIGSGGLVLVAIAMLALVPLGATALVGSPIGIVWFNAFDVMVWALVWLIGWGPNAVHSLVGAYRFLALALGYELPLMFALVSPAIAAGSLDVRVVAESQDGLWFVVWMPVAAAVYGLAVLGFANRGPLSAAVFLDLAGGVTSELAGSQRLLVQVGRYALLAAGSAFAVPLFLGGGSGPLLAGWVWVVLKTVLVMLALLVAADRLPLLRPDKLLELCWLVLLPLVVLQDLLTAVVTVLRG